jgi:ATP-dependent Zn protease
VESNAFVDEVVAWLPLIIVAAIWLFVMRRYKGNANEIMDMNREIIAMNRDNRALSKTMSETLLRIEKILQDRNA